MIGDIVQVFHLNQELCNLCGTCTDRCEFNALSIKDGQLWFNPCRCRRCDGCESLCPRGAMELEMRTINIRSMSEKENQDRYWEINTSCHITCDGMCNDCKK